MTNHQSVDRSTLLLQPKPAHDDVATLRVLQDQVSHDKLVRPIGVQSVTTVTACAFYFDEQLAHLRKQRDGPVASWRYSSDAHEYDTAMTAVVVEMDKIRARCACASFSVDMVADHLRRRWRWRRLWLPDVHHRAPALLCNGLLVSLSLPLFPLFTLSLSPSAHGSSMVEPATDSLQPRTSRGTCVCGAYDAAV